MDEKVLSHFRSIGVADGVTPGRDRGKIAVEGFRKCFGPGFDSPRLHQLYAG